MRPTTGLLFLLALGACPPPAIAPPPGADAGVNVGGGLEIVELYSVLRGGTTFGILQAVETGAVTGLSVAAPEALTVGLSAQSVAPGAPVLLRVSAKPNAEAPVSPYGGPAPLQFTITGSRDGTAVEIRGEVSLRDDTPAPRTFRALVFPPRLDVSTGAPATAQVFLEPMSSVSKGKVTLRSLPEIAFQPGTVELTSLEPVVVEMTVSPEYRAEAETRISVDGYMGRSVASSGTFLLKAKAPDPVTPPPVRISWVVPFNLYLRPGTSVPVDLAGPEADLKATAWQVFDLPQGITASAANGVVTFVAEAGAASGAHFVRLVGTREGYTESHRMRLMVARVDGDWPLLGDSPTARDSMGQGGPGPASIAFGGDGLLRVACASSHLQIQDVRAFQGGQWTVEVKVPACNVPLLDAANGLVCFATRDWDLPRLDAACWAGLPGPGAWAHLPLESLSYGMGGDALALLEADLKTESLYRWTGVEWNKATSKMVTDDSLLGLAPVPGGGFLLAENRLVDKLTSEGWVKVPKVEVSRFDGQQWTALDGSIDDAHLDFGLVDAFVPVAATAFAAAPDGSPIVAWIDSADEKIHARRWSAGAWQPLAAPLAPTPDFFAYELRMRVDAAGTPVIAWREEGYPTTVHFGGAEYRPNHIRVHRLGATGWEELTSAAPVNLDASGPASTVSLALDATGRPHVSWKESDWIFVARYAR